MKKAAALLGAVAVLIGMLSGCARTPKMMRAERRAQEADTLRLMVETCRLPMWREIAAGFEQAYPGVRVELSAEEDPEAAFEAAEKAGRPPDAVHLTAGRTSVLLQTLIADNALAPLTDLSLLPVISDREQLPEALLETAAQPYGDGKVFLLPLFSRPCGLLYDEAEFAARGFAVPATWEELWMLGERAKAEGMALFAFADERELDALLQALLYAAGGRDFYERCLRYEDGIWKSPPAQAALQAVERLAAYTAPADAAPLTASALLRTRRALFTPVGVSAETTAAGDADTVPSAAQPLRIAPLPKIAGETAVYTHFEQCFIPAKAKNKALAQLLFAYLLSDAASAILSRQDVNPPVALHGAPLLRVTGRFAATDFVEGVSMHDAFVHGAAGVLRGEQTARDWQQAIEQASTVLRTALKNPERPPV